MAGRQLEAIGVLAGLARVDSTTYRRWLRSNLVEEPADAATPSETNAMEAGAAACIFRELGDSDGRIAWKQVRQQVMAGAPTEASRIVWRAEIFRADFCRDDQEVGIAASLDTRPVRVVRVGAAAVEARDGLRRRATGLRSG
jgi:hypothetical protein